jgi:hypothetical protein
MRLTLRTLLAQLDGVPLENGDSGDLSKKIEESEFVRNLVQRIRTSISRPRLGAPKIDGQGLGHDPNTVAAYLDNTLPQDRMPDLEKICLESDVLLAEVAASHQILTLVLQTPVKAPPHLRDRIYRIGDLGKAAAESDPGKAAAAKVAAAPAPGAAAEAPAEKPAPRKREIPDYLRETRSLGWKPLAIAVLVGFLVAAGLLAMMGPLNANHPVLGFLVGDRAERPEIAQQVGDLDADPQPVPAPAPEPKTDDDEQDTESPPAPVESTTPSESDTNPAPPEVEPETEHATPAVSPSLESKEKPALPPGVKEQPGPGAVADATGDDAPGAAELASTSPTTDAPIPAPILADAPAVQPPAAEAAPAADVGRYISETEVLARYDFEGNAWMRLPTNAALAPGDRLLALPAYRPKLVLASGFQITLSGGTLVEFRGPEAPGMVNLSIEYGRIVVVPVGAAAGSVRLDCWGRQGEINFAGPESILAVQVRRYRAPGVNPEAGLAHRMVEIYALGGGLLWKEPGHPEQQINAGETFAFLDDARGGIAPTSVLPPWIEANDVDRTDELASQDIHLAVGYEHPLSRSLLELVEHRKVEVSALAARSLSYLDFFDPLIEALNNETQKSYWDDHFNELQRALARSPDTAREVRIALEKIRGRPTAAEIYRLLWSYSPADLEKGAATTLVEHLMSPLLDVRVLAIQNLERITGMTHLYRAEVEDARRKTAYQRWRTSLADGKIKYTEMVLMLPPRSDEAPAEEPEGAAPPDEDALPESSLPENASPENGGEGDGPF